MVEENNKPKISFFKANFWDLWLQKIFRNIASVKYQWLIILYVPVIYGMFTYKPDIMPQEPWISAALGLSFLGGGFVTLALGRIVANSRLCEKPEGDLDTDR
jgi:hypothetical protein